jgi:adenine-specific DNA-methyltransferase
MAAQRLELTWVGKGREPAVEPRILLHRKELDCGDADSGNMLIHGDNLLALKALEQEFAGRVKCIYIDPPYNTGSAFEHYDDNLEHSTWLSLMVPRLRILRNLLSDNGSIWISIDDDEGHYLKVLCDEIFGRGNFVTTISWQKRTSPDNRLRLGGAHDFILVYVKTFGNDKGFNQLPISGSRSNDYKNLDNDPRGAWASVDMTGQTGHATSNQYYTITTRSGKQYIPPEGRCWALAEETFLQLIADNRIWFGRDGNSRPRLKRFINEMVGVNSWSWWPNSEAGHNQEAKKENIALFGADKIFDTPKPERLIERVLTLATDPGDLVLDSFLGSGTTAAVAHKMRRRWIGVELGGHCLTHCLPRLRAVVDGEPGGVSGAVGWRGGGGFRFYELAPTLVVRDANGMEVISGRYNPDMLAAAVAKLCGYRYAPPGPAGRYVHGSNGAGGVIHVAARLVTAAFLAEIVAGAGGGRSLVVCAPAFQPGIGAAHPGVRLRKIPQAVLSKCEYGADDYNLNTVAPPDFDGTEGEFEDA